MGFRQPRGEFWWRGLLLLALPQATADKKWRYALTRQTKAAVKADLDDKQVLDLPVWKVEPESAFLVVTPPAANDGR